MIEYGPIIMQYLHKDTEEVVHWSDLQWCYLEIDDNNKVQKIKTIGLDSTPLSANCSTKPLPETPMWIYDPSNQTNKIYTMRVNEHGELLRYDFRIIKSGDATNQTLTRVLPLSKKFTVRQNGWGPDSSLNRKKPSEVIDDSNYAKFSENINAHLTDINAGYNEHTNQLNAASEVASTWQSARNDIDFSRLEQTYNEKVPKLSKSQQASFAKGQGFYLALMSLKSESESLDKYLQDLSDILSGSVDYSANSNAAIIRHYLIPSYIDKVNWYEKIAEDEVTPTIGDAYDWLTNILIQEGELYQIDFAENTKVLELSTVIRETPIGKFNIKEAVQGLNEDAITIFNLYYSQTPVVLSEDSNFDEKVLGILNSEPYFWQARSDLELLYYSSGGEDFTADFTELYKQLRARKIYLDLKKILAVGTESEIADFLNSFTSDIELQIIIKYSEVSTRYKLIEIMAKYEKFRKNMQANPNLENDNDFDLDAILIWESFLNEEIIPAEHLADMIKKIQKVLSDSEDSSKKRQQLEAYYRNTYTDGPIQSFYASLINVQNQLILEHSLSVLYALMKLNDKQVFVDYVKNIDDFKKLCIFLSFQEKELSSKPQDLFTQEKLLGIIQNPENLYKLLDSLTLETCFEIISIIGAESLIELIDDNIPYLISLLNNEKTQNNIIILQACAKIMEQPNILVHIVNSNKLSVDTKRKIIQNLSAENQSVIANNPELQEYLKEINPDYLTEIINDEDLKKQPIFSNIINNLPSDTIRAMFARRKKNNLPKVLAVLSPDKIKFLLDNDSINFRIISSKLIKEIILNLSENLLEAIFQNDSARKEIIDKLELSVTLKLCKDTKLTPQFRKNLFANFINSTRFTTNYLSTGSHIGIFIDNFANMDKLIELSESIEDSQQSIMLDFLTNKSRFFEALADDKCFDLFLDTLNTKELKSKLINGIVSENYSCVQTRSVPSFSGLAYIFHASDNLEFILSNINSEVLINAITSPAAKDGFVMQRFGTQEYIIDSLNEHQLTLFSQHFFATPSPSLQNILKSPVISNNINTLKNLVKSLPIKVDSEQTKSVYDLQKFLIKELIKQPNSGRCKKIGICLWMIATFKANIKLQNSKSSGQAIRSKLLEKERHSWSVWSIDKPIQEEFTSLINRINKIPDPVIDEKLADEILSDLNHEETSYNKLRPGASN